MRYVFSFFALCCFFGVTAQPADSIVLDTRIEEVVVFLQNAQIHRSSEVTIPAGKNILVLKRLSPLLMPETVKVQLQGTATILSVNHRMNFLDRREKAPGLKELTQRRELLQDSIRRIGALRSTLEEEIEFLKANRMISGKDQAYTLEELQAVNNYYTQRLRAIKLEDLELERQKTNLEKELQQIEKQQEEFRNDILLHSSEVMNVMDHCSVSP